jgi:putative transposase
MRVLSRPDWAKNLTMKRTLNGADHPQAQNGRAADRPGQDGRRRLQRDRDDAADLPPLETEVQGVQAEKARRLTQVEKENARLKKLLAEAELERQCSRTWLRREAHLVVRRETSEPGTTPESRRDSAGAFPGIRAAGLQGRGATPQCPTPSGQGRLD